jgi:hypothetical protein
MLRPRTCQGCGFSFGCGKKVNCRRIGFCSISSYMHRP